MAPKNDDGTDGSSIKPVSSLRSHFENMTKAQDAPPSPSPQSTPQLPQLQHSQSNKPSPPSPAPPPQLSRHPPIPQRPASPFIRSSKTFDSLPLVPKVAAAEPATQLQPQPQPQPQPPPIPKERPSVATLSAISNRLSEPGWSTVSGPPSSPQPMRPPAVNILPPQSPPKGSSPSMPMPNGDARFSRSESVTSSATPSPARSLRHPSPSRLASLDIRRSPVLPSSAPPSPPPPRRSTELRREREAKAAAQAASAAGRLEKPPPPPSRSSYLSETSGADARSSVVEEASPFSSPPSSPSSPEAESVPDLPARLNPPELPLLQVRPKTLAVGGFEPPPLHPSVANRRRERDQDGTDSGRTTTTTLVATEPASDRPAVPTRSLTLSEPTRRLSTTFPNVYPPPRPPRHSTLGRAAPSPSSSPPKRVVSTPATQQPPPPRRTHGRSTTIDRTSDRTPAEFRIAASPITATHPLASAPSRADTFPDAANANRRPPFIKQGMHEIPTKSDARVFDVYGEYVCTVGHYTRVWNLLDGELLLSFTHGDAIKGTAVAFKPGANVDEEAVRLWIGNSQGELMEADIATSAVITTKPNIHGRYEIIKIYRHYSDLWTLDENGVLHVWGADDETGVPGLHKDPHATFKVPKGHTFSMVTGDELWHATGKEMRIFRPSVDIRDQFQVLLRPLIQDSAGDVTSGTLLKSEPSKIYFGHVDGKVSIYSLTNYTCLGLVSISGLKINSLTGVGKYLWAAFSGGRIGVFDMSASPCVVRKEWQAHDMAVVRLVADAASAYRTERQQVVSLGADSRLRIWDGMLQEDWLEGEMKAHETRFCEFGEIKVMVTTWNAGASTPHSLRYSDTDDAFIRELLRSSGSPDIIVFGFQELVDLEDKTATAKRLFKSKKKDGSDQERMSHQYRDWRDFLMKSLDNYMPPDELYHLLQTSTLVGLFTCIFVKSTVRDKIRSLSSGEVKRGMGGYHGNKGAIIIRFLYEDTSVCFVNCHLAAGQSHAAARHEDLRQILESSVLPTERDPTVRLDSFVCGGDGTMVLDHELCVLNGDLNYRIDTMSRDTVVGAVRAGQLGKLLDRDQLLVARRRVATFRLRAFEELPITFAPTYKYDVGTDTYDTSEKRRSPAWCDRLLFRGGKEGRIQQMDYSRHEVRVSDHRPVSGRFRFTVRTVDAKRRDGVWADCQRRFEQTREQEMGEEKLWYLVNMCGYDEGTAEELIRSRRGGEEKSNE